MPPPIRRGRSGFYSADHVARLELVQDLQSHGFTLAAIEKYVAGIPASATPADIALHRTMLAPWQAEPPVQLTRAELDKRAGRALSADDLAVLTTLGVVAPAGRGRYRVAVAHLSVGLGLLDHGFPPEAAQAAAEVYAAHGRAIAEELYAVFKKLVWPAYKESGAPPGRAARGGRAAQAAVGRLAGDGVRGGHGRHQARGHRPPHRKLNGSCA